MRNNGTDWSALVDVPVQYEVDWYTVPTQWLGMVGEAHLLKVCTGPVRTVYSRELERPLAGSVLVPEQWTRPR